MITVSYETARERAARGVALLDDRSPGWWRTLRPESIVMIFSTSCVIGSLNPEVGYDAMLDKLDVVDNGAMESGTAAWYGFDIADDECDGVDYESYHRLTDVWRVIVAGRQVKAGLR